MKRVVIIGVVLLTILTGCANPLKKEKTNTPMKAAKAFVGALTSSNIIKLNKETYQSQSIPTEEIMGVAKMRHITGMQAKDFSFQQDRHDKDTINVSFKDRNGLKDTWKLVFVQNAAGKYQYDGFLSGTLLANSTPKAAALSYAQAMIHSGDKYWAYNLFDFQTPGPPSGFPDEGLVKKYHLASSEINQFQFKNGRTYDDGNGVRCTLVFPPIESKLMGMEINLAKREDGYYYMSTGLLNVVDSSVNNNLESPLKAAQSFVTALTYGSIHSEQLSDDKNIAGILKIASQSHLVGMKFRKFTFDSNGSNAVDVNLKNEDTWHLVFVKNKLGNYQFDSDQSGTLLANSSPKEVTQSYAQALIHKANAFELKSLILPSSRSGYSNKDAGNLVNNYQLQNKKLSNFKITTANNKVTIQFKDSAGTSHSIHLTTEKWKDGYYVVSHQFN